MQTHRSGYEGIEADKLWRMCIRTTARCELALDTMQDRTFIRQELRELRMMQKELWQRGTQGRLV